MLIAQIPKTPKTGDTSKMKKQEGFSLVELLVVVIIIAIVAAIAIPNLITSRRAANEASAASNLRTINSAEQTYLATLGGQTKYGDFAALTGGKFLDPSWQADVIKSTYKYPEIDLDATDQHGYCAEADAPDTNTKSFAISHPGAIYYIADSTTAPTCDSDTGDMSGTGVTVLGQ